MTATTAPDPQREEQGLVLENTGSHAARVAVIYGRVLKGELRKTAETSKGGKK